MCAGVREDSSLKDSHSAALKLIGELTDLRSNHSDLIEAEEKAKKDLQMKIQDRVKLKEQIQQQTVLNENYQKQIQALQTEKEKLQANITALEGTCGRCPEKWNLLDSSCYFFSYIESSYVTKSWQDSRMDCIGREADLIVIDSTEEQKFVSSTIYKMSGGRNVWEMGFWIGLTDRETEGRWVWINNVTEVDRRYWMDGEPNNIGQHGEDCGVTSYNTYDNIRKTRFDSFCRNNRYWICERKSSLGVS
ncbi:CD209 antigen-like protein C [Oryzias melastigma]|nr:CD209 antigen-like protein C [Oryzias melastigma]